LGLNSCISDPNLDMATWASKHYKLHEGSISLHHLMF
jgi:hypothetical protein